ETAYRFAEQVRSGIRVVDGPGVVDGDPEMKHVTRIDGHLARVVTQGLDHRLAPVPGDRFVRQYLVVDDLGLSRRDRKCERGRQSAQKAALYHSPPPPVSCCPFASARGEDHREPNRSLSCQGSSGCRMTIGAPGTPAATFGMMVCGSCTGLIPGPGTIAGHSTRSSSI